MTERLAPSRMAEIYFAKLHFGAVQTAKKRMDESEEGSATFLYWKEVHAIVEARAMKMKTYRAGKPAKTQEREAHV